MSRRLGSAVLFAALAAAAGVAQAGHEAAMSDHHHDDASSIAVGVAVQAAEFETMAYVGSYQGITPSLAWMHGRFGANATLGLYHLEENGLSAYGAGDVTLGGHATVVTRDAFEAGAALHVMLPTGSAANHLGMGHAMASPGLWATWRPAPVALTASAGYARALASLEGGGHHHGAGSLVEPMNPHELTWSAAADVEVGHRVRVGGRALGAFAIGDGQTRVIGGGRVAWGTGQLSTAFELQVGLAGDPFTVRGVLETALRF